MPKLGRDEFSAKTKRRLAERAGFKCSFPGCSQPTIGPSLEANDASASIGEACHIISAASGLGARRRDPSLTSEERRSIDNGIWMCRTHAKLIDSDEQTYTVKKLRRWKQEAEERARITLETGNSSERRTDIYEQVKEIHETIVNGQEKLPTPYAGCLNQTPPLPRNYVVRSEKCEALKQLIMVNNLSSGTLVISAVHGLGGVGKSILAMALCHDESVLAHFHHGILWTTLGQEPDLLSILTAWIFELGDHDFNPTTISAATAHLRVLVRHKTLLVVIDDVWAPEDASPLIFCSDPSRVLVTTRRADVAHELKAHLFELDVMEPNEAYKLLFSRFCGPPSIEEYQHGCRLAQLLGNLPLALELASARVSHGRTFEDLCEALNEETARLGVLESPRHRRKKYKLHAIISLSITALQKDDEDAWCAFLWLGLLPEDVHIHPFMAAPFLGVNLNEATEILDLLWNDALLMPGATISYNNKKLKTFRFHDLLRNTARNMITTTPPEGLGLTLLEAYGMLVDRYAKNTRNGLWHTLPPDGHVHQFLVWYLEKAGYIDQIQSLFKELTEGGENGWYYAREQLGQVSGFLEDLNRAKSLLVIGEPKSILSEIRYTLLSTSVKSQFSNVTPRLILDLENYHVWSLTQTLAHARQLPDLEMRAEVLIKLIPRTMGTQREETIRDATTYVMLVNNPQLASLLLEWLLLDPMLEVIDVYSKKGDDLFLENAVRCLVNYSQDNPPLMKKAFDLATNIKSEEHRVDALIHFLPIPEYLFQTFLSQIEAIINPKLQTYLMVRLSPSLNGKKDFMPLVLKIPNVKGRISILFAIVQAIQDDDLRRVCYEMLKKLTSKKRDGLTYFIRLMREEHRNCEIFQEIFADLPGSMDNNLQNQGLCPMEQDIWTMAQFGHMNRATELFKELDVERRNNLTGMITDSFFFNKPGRLTKTLRENLKFSGLHAPSEKKALPNQVEIQERLRTRLAQSKVIEDGLHMLQASFVLTRNHDDPSVLRHLLLELLDQVLREDNYLAHGWKDLVAKICRKLLDIGLFERVYQTINHLSARHHTFYPILFELFKAFCQKEDFRLAFSTLLSLCNLNAEQVQLKDITEDEAEALSKDVYERIGNSEKYTLDPNRSRFVNYGALDSLIDEVLLVLTPKFIVKQQWESVFVLVEIFGFRIRNIFMETLPYFPEAFRKQATLLLFNFLKINRSVRQTRCFKKLIAFGFEPHLLYLAQEKINDNAMMTQVLVNETVQALRVNGKEPTIGLEMVMLLESSDRDKLLNVLLEYCLESWQNIGLEVASHISDKEIRFHALCRLRAQEVCVKLVMEEIVSLAKAYPPSDRFAIWLEQGRAASWLSSWEFILPHILQAALDIKDPRLHNEALIEVIRAACNFGDFDFCNYTFSQIDYGPDQLESLLEVFPLMFRLNQKKAFDIIFPLLDRFPPTRDRIILFQKLAELQSKDLDQFVKVKLDLLFSRHSFVEFTPMEIIKRLGYMNLPDTAHWVAQQIQGCTERAQSITWLARFFYKENPLWVEDAISAIRGIACPVSQGYTLLELVDFFTEKGSIVINFARTIVETSTDLDVRMWLAEELGLVLAKRSEIDAITFIEMIDSAPQRSIALERLVKKLMTQNDMTEAIQAAAAIPFVRKREQVYLNLIRHLLEYGHEKAILAARGLIECIHVPTFLAQALALSVHFRSSRQEDQTAKQALTLACNIPFSRERHHCLMYLCWYLPNPWKVKAAFAALEALQVWPFDYEREAAIEKSALSFLKMGESSFAVRAATLSLWRTEVLLMPMRTVLYRTGFQAETLEDHILEKIPNEILIGSYIDRRQWDKAWDFIRALPDPAERDRLVWAFVFDRFDRDISIILRLAHIIDNNSTVVAKTAHEYLEQTKQPWMNRDALFACLALRLSKSDADIALHLSAQIESYIKRLWLLQQMHPSWSGDRMVLFDEWWLALSEEPLWEHLEGLTVMISGLDHEPVDRVLVRLVRELEFLIPKNSHLEGLQKIVNGAKFNTDRLATLITLLLRKHTDFTVIAKTLAKLCTYLGASYRDRQLEQIVEMVLIEIREGTDQNGLTTLHEVISIMSAYPSKRRFELWRLVLRTMSFHPRKDLFELLPEIMGLIDNQQTSRVIKLIREVSSCFP